MGTQEINVVKCPKCGKWYDGNHYPACPFCGGEPADATPETTESEKEKGGFASLFRFGGKKAKEVDNKEVDEAKQETPPALDPPDSGPAKSTIIEASQDTPKSKSVSRVPEKNPTQDFWSVNPFSVADVEERGPVPIEAPPESTPPVQKGDNEAPAGIEPNKSLRDEIQQSSSTKKGVTLSYFSAITGNPSEENPKTPAEPVVGWIVCVKGVRLGESFQLYSGNCSIGRDNTNKIVIDGDQAISGIKHAFLIYEPKKRSFFIKPGDSSGLVYVNGDFISETTQLHSRDTIELGNSSFLFVPLCDDTFSWEEYINKD